MNKHRSLWSFLRAVLDQGMAIQKDYEVGQFSTYEHLSARLDEAAREREEECLRLMNQPLAACDVAATIPERKRRLLEAIDHDAAQRQLTTRPLQGRELRDWRALRVLLGGNENVSVESTIERIANTPGNV